jgi:Fe-S cluster assembly iron-binding protein IscA
MLIVTENAAAVLDRSLAASRENESDILRLVRSGQGVGLTISEEQEGDHVIQYEDRKILAVEPEILRVLDKATIDAVNTPEGLRLTLRPPGAQ